MQLNICNYLISIHIIICSSFSFFYKCIILSWFLNFFLKKTFLLHLNQGLFVFLVYDHNKLYFNIYIYVKAGILVYSLQCITVDLSTLRLKMDIFIDSLGYCWFKLYIDNTWKETLLMNKLFWYFILLIFQKI